MTMNHNKTDKGTEQFSAVIRNLRVSVCSETDCHGEKDYRSVFGTGETGQLYADAEIFNREFGVASREWTLTFRFFRLVGEKSECISARSNKITLEPEDSLVIYTETFVFADMPGNKLEEGTYRVLADINGVAFSSDDIYVLPGNGVPEEYFRLLQAGLDRSADESEEVARNRPHSFRMFDESGLKGIRFFLMALNLSGREWVYEFVLRVVGKDGSIRVQKTVRSANFTTDRSGNSILCFGLDLWGDGEPVQTGEYRLIVSCFGQVILSVGFVIGNRDLPYDFQEEVLAGGEHADVRRRMPAAFPDEDKDEIMDRIYRLVGLRKVKEEITKIVDYAEFIRLRRENGFSDMLMPMHLVFTGHPGTGKNTVAGMVGELYSRIGLLENGNVNHFRRDDLLGDGMAVEEQLLRQALKKCEGGILFMDDVCDLFCPDVPDDRGMAVLNLLSGILTREKPDVMVILADGLEEMNRMLEALPDLKKLFPRHFCFEDYTPEELMEITRSKLEKLQYRFSPAAEEKFYGQLKMACRANGVDFTNGHYIDEQIEEATLRMSRRLMTNRKGEYKKEELMLITEEDLPCQREENPGKYLEKLNAMVGLKQLKQSIAQHMNYVYFIRERQKHGFQDVIPPLNMILCGNPGTGKMTITKMMGEIYHSVGVLARSTVVVQDGRNLTAESGMQPQEAAEALMDMAAGGMLYIDHADAMMQNDFGVALFEALLADLSAEECGDTIVTLGGYPDSIEKMLVENPAVKAYFPYVFQFKDYTPGELLQIAEDRLRGKNFVFHPKAREVLEELIRKGCESRDKSFGNALLVEKIVDLAIRNMSGRTMKIRQKRELTRQEITTIRKEDIPTDIFGMPKFGRDDFDETEIGAALVELDRMVGQPGIKREIRDFVELARHYNHDGIKLSTRLSLQWCFTGNSAMGKGRVARIIARLYKAMGIVNTDKVLDFMVERMIGLTEEEIQCCIGEALVKSAGGILLFDEDSLKLNESYGFRERVRAILMNQMAERPGSYIIIYAEPRENLPGLNGTAENVSELVNVLIFEDYTKEELMLILKRRLAKEKMKMTATARQYMTDFIGLMVSTEERSRSSSRLMRIVADLIVRNCLQRIARKEAGVGHGGEISVQKRDVVQFTEEFIAGIMKERKRIGFVRQ